MEGRDRERDDPRNGDGTPLVADNGRSSDVEVISQCALGHLPFDAKGLQFAGIHQCTVSLAPAHTKAI